MERVSYIPYCNEQVRDTNFQCRQNNLAVQDPIKIASLPLKQYKQEDISLDVNGEIIILTVNIGRERRWVWE